MLTKGERLTLASLYLSSFYGRLNKCSQIIYKSFGWYNIVTYADAPFLQMFLWERFRTLSPKLVEFKSVKLEKVIIDREEKEKTCHHKPRGLGWSM